MNCILAIRSAIKTRFGRRGLAADHVQGLWQAMGEESEGFNYSGKKFSKISEVKKKGEGFLLVYKVNNYSKTTTLMQN